MKTNITVVLILGLILGCSVLPATAARDEEPKPLKGVEFELNDSLVVAQPRTAVMLPFTGKEAGAAALRSSLYTILAASSALRLTNPATVDAILERENIERDDIDELTPSQLYEWFGCDVVLYCRVDSWSRTYVIVQSQATVKATLRMVDARTGDELAEMEVKASRGAGLTQVPTGIFGAVVSPLKGMQERFLYVLAEQATDKAGRVFANPADVDPALAQPEITSATYAFGKDAVGFRETLQVSVQGTPGARGFVHWGEPRNAVPLTEAEPGQYVGLVYLPATLQARTVQLTTVLNLPGAGAASATIDQPLTMGRR